MMNNEKADYLKTLDIAKKLKGKITPGRWAFYGSPLIFPNYFLSLQGNCNNNHSIGDSVFTIVDIGNDHKHMNVIQLFNTYDRAAIASVPDMVDAIVYQDQQFSMILSKLNDIYNELWKLDKQKGSLSERELGRLETIKEIMGVIIEDQANG